jgi:hypothetical protein
VTTLLTDIDEAERLLDGAGFVLDTAVCGTCHHRRASHASGDQRIDGSTIGSGGCGFHSCDCDAFVVTGTYSIEPIYPDRDAEDAAHAAWIGRRHQHRYWAHPETVMPADRAARVREQYASGQAPAWLYSDPDTIRKLIT